MKNTQNKILLSLLISTFAITSLSLTIISNNESLPIQNIRQRYYKAVSSENEANDLLKYLNNLQQTNPLVEGYIGGVTALKAKHAWNPYDKITYLDKADKHLTIATKISPSNIEIRFIRFSYEHYVPSFLGRSKHIEEDKKVILAGIKANNQAIPSDLMSKIKSFLKESNRLSETELKSF